MSGFLATNDPLDSGASVPNGSSLRVKPSPPAVSSEPVTPAASEFPLAVKAVRTRPQSPVQPPQKEGAIAMQLAAQKEQSAQSAQASHVLSPPGEGYIDDDPFDVRETVNMLTLQFLSDHPETRIAALEWLLMLHLKAPTKVGTTTVLS